jgi:ABC-2 type transport system permease protein
MSAPRPFVWSVRREVWEHPSIVVGPLAVACVALFGFLVSAFTLARRMRAVELAEETRQRAAVTMPYGWSAGLILATVFVVAFFYCLDALHGERRDRSLLFWKSLPVSDATAVLAKASIPLAVLPLLALAVTVGTHVSLRVVNALALLPSRHGLHLLAKNLHLFQMWIAIAWALLAAALWHAPLYAWLLFVSGWARRAVFLWAIAPFAAIGIFERIAFRASPSVRFLKYLVAGWYARAFVPMDAPCPTPLEAITPFRFLAWPGVWIGLAVAGGLLAATVSLRRSREPI